MYLIHIDMYNVYHNALYCPYIGCSNYIDIHLSGLTIIIEPLHCYQLHLTITITV